MVPGWGAGWQSWHNTDLPPLGPAWQVEKRRISLPRVLSAPPVAGTVCHAYDREVHLRCELSPGYYLAVPSTFLKDVPGRFLLRVFSTGRVALRWVGKGGVQLNGGWGGFQQVGWDSVKG